MTDRSWRGPETRPAYLARARALRRLGHLVESGALSEHLTADLQLLREMAQMWEIAEMLKCDRAVMVMIGTLEPLVEQWPEEMTVDDLCRRKRNIVGAMHRLALGLELVKARLKLRGSYACTLLLDFVQKPGQKDA